MYHITSAQTATLKMGTERQDRNHNRARTANIMSTTRESTRSIRINPGAARQHMLRVDRLVSKQHGTYQHDLLFLYHPVHGGLDVPATSSPRRVRTSTARVAIVRRGEAVS